MMRYTYNPSAGKRRDGRGYRANVKADRASAERSAGRRVVFWRSAYGWPWWPGVARHVNALNRVAWWASGGRGSTEWW